MKYYNTREGIAIIGMGAIMPGALNKDIFWKNILEGKSSIVEVPPDRWDWHLYYDPDPKAPDKTYSKIGGFIKDFRFDPIKHRIPPQVGSQMARLQHMAIETAVMALKDSGYDKKPYNTQRTAVILGNSMGGMKKEETDLRVYRAYYNDVLNRTKSFSSLPSDSRQAILEEVDRKISTSIGVITEDTMPGELSNVTAGRIASVLNVNGPNYTVDAACASSIAALDQAVKGLRLNDFDVAICGGADEMMSAPAYVKFCKIGALSPDGSWVFDARANGFVMAEGVGIFVLKRISDAVKDGDRIYAVINAIGSSSDGKGKAITAPNPKGQKLALERTFQQLDYTPADISFMEAHGTATKAGDVAEGEVLNGFFSPYVSAKGSIGLGSVKSNIGHTKAAAGAASLAKTIMALHNKIIPPSINFVTPNPNIDFKNSPFRVITKLQEWVSPNRIRRANISSFGFGGSNFHVALEEYDEKTTRLPDPHFFGKKVEQPPNLKVPSVKLQSESMTISATTREALLNKVDSLITSTNMDENWPMVLFTHPFNTSRHEHFAVSLTADSPSKLKTKLKFLAEQAETGRPWEKHSLHLKMKGIYPFHPKPSKVKIGFLFPGQGSQYVDMMKDLASKYQVVQDTFDEADVILKKLINTTLTEVLYSKPGESASELARREEAIKQTQMTQPAVLTADTAMLRLLDSFGVRPDMVCGHSLGEYAAAVAAGIFTFENGIRAVTSRAKEMSNIKVDDPGKMASVALSFEKVERELKKIKGYVICANKNCPTQTVIAGEKTAVTEAIKLFNSMGVQAGGIPVSHAFHSAIIQPAEGPYSRFLEKIPVSKPVVPILSNVTADYFPSDEKGVRDLLVRQIVNPVEFIRQLERMYADGARLFVECGPKRVLSAFATGTLHDKNDIRILSSNHPKRGGILEFNDMLSNLTASGVKLDWNGKNPQDSGNVYTPAYTDWAAKHHFTYDTVTKKHEPDRITVSRSAGSSQAWEKYGFNSNPIVITGIAAGTPGSWDKLFREGNIDEILRGQNLIEPISQDMQQKQIDKNIIRVIKSATGDHRIERVDSTDQAIKLAAVKGEFDLEKEFGVPKTVVNAMDSTFRMSLAVGILALKDAGLPLMRLYKKTSTGRYLPERWALPESVGDDTGVIFASAFPIAESIITEVADHLVERFRNQSMKEIWTVYDSMIQKIHDPKDRQALSTWFARNFNRYHEEGGKGPHTFSQNFLLKAIPIGNSQFAQWVRARGPSMHLSAACASTTESVAVAEDWIRTGRAKRVVIIAADDITSEAIQDWYLAGFVASGAATTEGNLSDAALPFDRRRHGLIVGIGAVGIVVEDETLVKERGMKPLVRLLGSEFANSGFHVTRLDTNHVGEMMDRLMTKVEKIHGLDRSKIANKTLFMSHETYTPARGGSASAEVVALKKTFGKDADKVIVSNVKGFTGHTMGASLEDVVAIRALTTGQVPPIANYKEPDPELAGITLSKGGKYDLEYALRFAAGFGSQMATTFVQRTFKEGESRFEDPVRYKNWLQKVSGNAQPELEVEFNTLRIKDAGAPEKEPAKEKETVTVSAVSAPTTPQPSTFGEGLPSAAGTMTTADTSHSAPSVQVSQPTATAAPSSVSEESVKTTILDMISGKTGYPKDMLELDLDMEADLGIDTVKQAELFAAIREHYSIPRREGAALKDYPTIRHCIKFVMEEKSAAGPASTPASVTKPEPTSAPVATAPTPAQSTTPTAITPVSAALTVSPASASPSVAPGMETEVKEIILGMISEKTGYPKDMLELDLDMEADLGIDTVKQAELFAAIREHYSIPRREGAALKDYPTIRHCIKFVMEEKGTAGPAPAATPETTPAPSKTAAAPVSRHVRYVPTLVQCPVEKEIIRKLSSKKPIVIFSDDAALIKAFSTELDNLKAVYHIFTSLRLKNKNSTTLDWTDLSSVEKALTSFAAKNPEVQGVIYLLGCEPKNLDENTLAHKDLTRMTIPLFLAGKHFNNGLSNPDESFATFMAVVTRVDGAFGYRTDASYDPIYGAVSAVAYCFRKELPKSSVKLVDFSPAMTPSAIAKKTLYEALRGDTRLGISYHSGKRWTLVMKPVTLAKGKCLDLKGKAVLVTGGGRGLGAEFSKILAARHQPHIIIMDIIDLQDKTPQWAAMTEDQLKTLKNEMWRSLKSSSGKKATPVMLEKAFAKVKDSIQLYRTMEDIKKLGSEVAYFFCDITEHDLFNDIMEKIKSKYGKIDGIVHFAGIERSKLAVDKTLAEFFKVFDTKAASAMMLVNSGVIKEGGFKVFISSIAGRFGNVGQTDYAAASDYLSKLAVSLTNRGERALAVDMSAYADIGMAMRPGVEAFLKSQNVEFLYPREGMETICDELAYGKVPEIVLSAGLGKLDLDKQLEVAGSPTSDRALSRGSAATEGSWEAAADSSGTEQSAQQSRAVTGPSPKAEGSPAKTGHHAKSVAGYPMIEKTTEHEHGKKLLAIKEFSLEKDPYLKDHSIGGTPYVPGVMGIETFVETANLFWKKTVHALENVSFSLPVKLLRNNPVEIRINAIQKSGDVLEMSMESDFVNPQGVKLGSARTHFTAQAVKSPAQPSASGDQALKDGSPVEKTGTQCAASASPPALSRESAATEGSREAAEGLPGTDKSADAGLFSAWNSIDKPAIPETDKFEVSHDVIYKAFFHGPSFKVLGGILRLDRKSLLSVYKKPSRPIWPEDPAKAEGLLAHPLLIEAALQTCGYRDIHFTKRMTLPDAIKRVLIFTHGEEPDMLFVYSIFKGQDNSGKSIYDAFVFDKDGKLWIELNDYLMIPV